MKRFIFASLGIADIEMSFYTIPPHWFLLFIGIFWVIYPIFFWKRK